MFVPRELKKDIVIIINLVHVFGEQYATINGVKLVN